MGRSPRSAPSAGDRVVLVLLAGAVGGRSRAVLVAHGGGI